MREKRTYESAYGSINVKLISDDLDCWTLSGGFGWILTRTDLYGWTPLWLTSIQYARFFWVTLQHQPTFKTQLLYCLGKGTLCWCFYIIYSVSKPGMWALHLLIYDSLQPQWQWAWLYVYAHWLTIWHALSLWVIIYIENYNYMLVWMWNLWV